MARIQDYKVSIKGYRTLFVRAANAANARKYAQAIVRKEFNKSVVLTTSNSTVTVWR